MTRRHALSISLLLTMAAVAGTLAAFRIAGVGRSAQAAISNAAIAARNRRLDHVEASLRRALAHTPPAAHAPARAAQKIVYVRPAPIVHVLRRSGEREDGGQEGGGDD